MTHSPVRQILVAGATVRPVVRSIQQAGQACRAIDLFADWDTQKLCPVDEASSMVQVEQLTLQTIGDDRLVLASGGENFSFVASDSGQLAKAASATQWRQLNKSLIGSSIEAIQKARDPIFLYRTLADANLPALRVQLEPPTDCKWLWKPLASCGGRGVKQVSRNAKPSNFSGGYFQQRKDGRIIGAAYLADESDCNLIECSHQSCGQLGEDPFAWRSAYSDHLLADEDVRHMAQVGRHVAKQTGLIGWFGIDFIATLERKPFLLEVNPRYTATMEIWERRTGLSLFELHYAISTGTELSRLPLTMPKQPSVHIYKRYLYNQEAKPLQVTEAVFRKLVAVSDDSENCFVTDLPNAGTEINPNDPVCTTWVADADPEQTASQAAIRFQRQILRWFE